MTTVLWAGGALRLLPRLPEVDGRRDDGPPIGALDASRASMGGEEKRGFWPGAAGPEEALGAG